MVADHQGGQHQGRVNPSMVSNVGFWHEAADRVSCQMVAFGVERTYREGREGGDPSLLSSRPEEFHPRALPEPCMTLSSHTAPDVRPLP